MKKMCVLLALTAMSSVFAAGDDEAVCRDCSTEVSSSEGDVASPDVETDSDQE